MSVAVQRDTLNSTKPNATNCLIAEDPSLMFSIVKLARDQRVPGSLLARLRGGKMRDHGNKVAGSHCLFSNREGLGTNMERNTEKTEERRKRTRKTGT